MSNAKYHKEEKATVGSEAADEFPRDRSKEILKTSTCSSNRQAVPVKRSRLKVGQNLRKKDISFAEAATYHFYDKPFHAQLLFPRARGAVATLSAVVNNNKTAICRRNQ